MSPRERDEPVRLTRIYTRAGDEGETHLGDGSRVSKLDARIGASGAVDELNSQLGVVLAGECPEPFVAPLRRIQNELFDLGADLSVPSGIPDRLRVTDEQVAALELLCDGFNAELPELKSFVLPGGSLAAAAPPRRAHDLPPGRARGAARRPGDRRESGCARVPEPALRPALHPRAGRERGRRGAALEAGRLDLYT